MNVIITGTKGVGKSTVCYYLVNSLRSSGKSVGGVITINKDGIRYFYLVRSQQELLFEAVQGRPFVIVGRFRIDRRHFLEAKQTLIMDVNNNYLIIDEIGLLELNEKGYYPEFVHVINHRNNDTIVVVRQEILQEIKEKYPQLRDYTLFNLTTRASKENSGKILTALLEEA